MSEWITSQYESGYIRTLQITFCLVRPMCMQRTAWIWLLGCVTWAIDGAINVALRALQHAELAFLMAILFGIAWLFYRGQRR